MRNTLIVIAICALIVLVGIFAPGAINAVFNALDLALGWLGAFWVVVIVSAITGVLFILAFPHVSLQNGIKSVKDRIKFNLLSIRLFQDDLGNVMKSTGGTLGWNFTYLGMNFIPLIFMAGPFMFVWFQLNSLYAFKPLSVGDTQTIAVELKKGVAPEKVEFEVAGDGGLEILVGPVAVQDSKVPKLVLEMRAAKDGVHDLQFTYQGTTFTKQVYVGEERPKRLAPMMSADPWGGFFATEDPIVYFGDPILGKDDFLQSIHINYPAAPLGPTGGGELWIMGIFVVVSLVVGFGLKGVFGVEI